MKRNEDEIVENEKNTKMKFILLRRDNKGKQSIVLLIKKEGQDE